MSGGKSNNNERSRSILKIQEQIDQLQLLHDKKQDRADSMEIFRIEMKNQRIQFEQQLKDAWDQFSKFMTTPQPYTPTPSLVQARSNHKTRDQTQANKIQEINQENAEIKEQIRELKEQLEQKKMMLQQLNSHTQIPIATDQSELVQEIHSNLNSGEKPACFLNQEPFTSKQMRQSLDLDGMINMFELVGEQKEKYNRFAPTAYFYQDSISHSTLFRTTGKQYYVFKKGRKIKLLLGIEDYRNKVVLDVKIMVDYGGMNTAQSVFDIMFDRGGKNARYDMTVVLAKALKLFGEMNKGKNGEPKQIINYMAEHVVGRGSLGMVFQACNRVGGAGFDPLLNQVSNVKDTFWRSLQLHTIRGTTLGSFALVARALTEKTELIKWSLLLKALSGLLALNCGNGYIVGINQIYDVGIDKVNKPYLPIAAGDLSEQSAWILVVSFALIGLLIVGMNFGPFISALYCLGLFLGIIYSVPLFRMKGFLVVAFLIIAMVRGFLLNFGVYYATRAAFGLTFEWSSPIVFITTFVRLFALVIAITKDLSDVEGDRKFQISTLATKLGDRNIVFLVDLNFPDICITKGQSPFSFQGSSLLTFARTLGFLFRAFSENKRASVVREDVWSTAAALRDSYHQPTRENGNAIRSAKLTDKATRKEERYEYSTLHLLWKGDSKDVKRDREEEDDNMRDKPTKDEVMSYQQAVLFEEGCNIMDYCTQKSIEKGTWHFMGLLNDGSIHPRHVRVLLVLKGASEQIFEDADAALGCTLLGCTSTRNLHLDKAIVAANMVGKFRDVLYNNLSRPNGAESSKKPTCKGSISREEIGANDVLSEPMSKLNLTGASSQGHTAHPLHKENLVATGIHVHMTRDFLQSVENLSLTCGLLGKLMISKVNLLCDSAQLFDHSLMYSCASFHNLKLEDKLSFKGDGLSGQSLLSCRAIGLKMVRGRVSQAREGHELIKGNLLIMRIMLNATFYI